MLGMKESEVIFLRFPDGGLSALRSKPRRKAGALHISYHQGKPAFGALGCCPSGSIYR